MSTNKIERGSNDEKNYFNVNYEYVFVWLWFK